MGSSHVEQRARRRIGDRFEVVRLLGEGASAHVYRARELSSGRDVAIKLLKESVRSDAEMQERFKREVFAVASIDSPHVVKLRDFGISGEDVFIAMEYVEGPTLRDLLDGKPWAPEVTHLVVGQIAQALAAAHRQDIVHRDLKPENVMLVKGARGRQVKVLDFGFAKVAELERKLGLAPLSRVGVCFGTPQYMSPEQIQGKPTDRCADLWALAVMAYEMLAGRMPWNGASPREVLMGVISKRLEPLEKVHAEVTRVAELNRFFARALSRKRNERPQDATELFSAFEQALFGQSRPPTDALFSGIVSSEVELPQLEDATLVEASPAERPGFEPTLPGAPRDSLAKNLFSLQMGQPLGDKPLASLRTLPSAAMTPSERIKMDASIATGLEGELYPPKQHESVTDRIRRGVPPRTLLLLSAAVVMLVMVAAFLGYFIGRMPR